MTTDELKRRIHQDTPEWFKQRYGTDKKGKGIICPICNSGSGPHGTGPTNPKGQPHKFTCWAGCYKAADAIEIIGEKILAQYGYINQLKATADYMGISYTLDDFEGIRSPERAKPKPEPAAQEEDLTEYFLQANKNIETEYLSNRGISGGTQNANLIGYVAKWRHPNANPNTPATERIIIPTSKTSYLARDINDNGKFSKQKVGKIHLFNSKALQSKEAVYITEGEIDALSLIELGYKAVGLGGAQNDDLLISHLKAHPTEAPLLLVPDNDEPGRATMERLLTALEEMELDAQIIDITGDHKDPNERLVKDREGLRAAISEETEKALDLINSQTNEYIKSSALNQLDDFTRYINRDKPRTKTGFNQLDEALGGGFMDGQLIIIGAVSGAGKTTYAMQIMDHIAKSGRDVLIFSLEMSRNELIAKSISRETRWHDMPEYFVGSATAQQVLNIIEQEEEKRERIESALQRYGDYAGRIYIKEGNLKLTVDHIIKGIKDHIKFTGNKPAVLIDYIQVLAPPDALSTDKQNIDTVVTALKTTARDLEIPIIGISSFNRNSYGVLSMAGMKGSGNIEYTADTIITIGYRYRLEEWNKTDDPDMLAFKKQTPAPTKIKILKSRTGAAGGEIRADFYNAFNYFYELPQWEG